MRPSQWRRSPTLSNYLAVFTALTAALWPGASPAQPGMTTISQDEAVERALAAAPELKASAEARRAAAGARIQAGVRPNPVLELEAENVAGSGPFDGFGQGEYTYSVGQRIERGGKRAARLSLADAGAEAARIDEERTGLDVVFEVRLAYLDAMAAAAQLEVAEQQTRLAATLENEVRSRVANARDPEAALLSISARALQFETDEALSKNALMFAKEQLASYWVDAPETFAVDWAPLFAPPGAGAPGARSLAGSPEAAAFAAAEERAAAALWLEEANAKQDPTVSLGVKHFPGEDAVAGLVRFSMPLALFDTNEGAIARARAERKRAEWSARAGLLRLQRQYQAALGDFRAAAAESQAIRRDVIPKAEAALDAARAGYDRGAFTYLDVIEAQRALADLKSREIAALTRLRRAEITLDRLTGREAEGSESVE